MILKKSSAALTEQDPIKGFIRSLAIQHNGLTRTLATPSVAAQKSVALRALSAAGISVNDVVLLEGCLGSIILVYTGFNLLDRARYRNRPW